MIQSVVYLHDLNTMADMTCCRRCGTCCLKGGPCLHLEDQALVESGLIALTHLFTIRQGEPAFDNITGNIAPAVTDIIKINGAEKNQKQCLYYVRKENGCRIYSDRPIECQALNCWDTQSIESVYNCRRLTRRHLLSRVHGLWPLVQEHQERCDYGHVAELATQLKQLEATAEPQSKLLEIIRYDDILRQLTLERSGLDPQMLLFLFGRPLSFTIQMFQLKIGQSDHGPTIQPIGPSHRQVCYRRQ